MNEQSHKDEMSAALRGDFQRLRDRGVAVTLTPSEPDEAVSEPAPLTETVSATDSRQDALSDASVADADDEVGDEPRGWLHRLLGR